MTVSPHAVNVFLWSLLLAMGLQVIYLGWRVKRFRYYVYFGGSLTLIALVLTDFVRTEDFPFHVSLGALIEVRITWAIAAWVVYGVLVFHRKLVKDRVVKSESVVAGLGIIITLGLLLELTRPQGFFWGVRNHRILPTPIFFWIFAPQLFLALGTAILYLVRGMKTSGDRFKFILLGLGWAGLVFFVGLDLIIDQFPVLNRAWICTLFGLAIYGSVVMILFGRDLFQIYQENENALRRLNGAYALLQQTVKLRDIGFATAGINHDIRNYSATLRNNAILLGSRNAADASRPVVLELAESLNRLAERLGPEAPAAKPPWSSPLRLTRVIKASANRFRGKLEIELPQMAEEESVPGDPVELDRVFHNLFQNSLDAGATRIQVTFRRQNTGLEIVMTDNGSGDQRFDGNFANAAFHSSKRDKGGIGIGMTLVREILARHGAELCLHNAKGEPGGSRGLSVTLVFPRKAPGFRAV